MSRKRISILGSTGSIGKNAIRVIRENKDKFQIIALAAGKNWKELAKQAIEFSPSFISISDRKDVPHLKSVVPSNVRILCGDEGLREIAKNPDVDVVLSALVGSIGLIPTIDAIKSGTAIAIANKEVLVMAGDLVMTLSESLDVPLLPVDSEHAGIAQILAGHEIREVQKIILTASGGPFREFDKISLENVTLKQALSHPNWDMGAKISVDSATLMNKGFELIEARWLFGLEPSFIDVIIHPQSIVHALVEFVDGSVIAQMSVPDMRFSIAQAISPSERVRNNIKSLNLADLGKLTFENPKEDLFPCLKYAKEAMKVGGTAPAVLNASNQVAVDAFIRGEINFLDISNVIIRVLDKHEVLDVHDIDDVLQADRWASELADKFIKKKNF
tara:strand:- start:4690 stop:5853 length:1164 start_codon:yes stop_codon:yes gene_type:complete